LTDLPTYLAMFATVAMAYTIFGLTGFGSAMVAVPILVQFVPLGYAVPLVVLLDLASTLALGVRNWKLAAGGEMLWLVPFMALGIGIGVVVLAGTNSRWLLFVLGAFVLANVAWNLFAGAARLPLLGRRWAVPAGLVGGIFSAMFGTGGPIYTLYLLRRLENPSVFRATIASVILVSALLRLAAFGASGLLHQPHLLIDWVALLPACALGVWTGNHLHGILSPHRARQAMLGVLALGGLGVLAKAFSG
jgi:uncharacterized protein